MENKYNMTQKDNIYLAKRLLVDSIYRSANLEGIISDAEKQFRFSIEVQNIDKTYKIQ